MTRSISNFRRSDDNVTPLVRFQTHMLLLPKRVANQALPSEAVSGSERGHVVGANK